MKLAKFAFVCAAAVSLTAVADGEYTSSTLAILPVTKTLNAMPLTVNFTAADGTALPATKIVKTAGLPAGSALYVYNKTAGTYTKYELSGTEWVPAQGGKTYVINNAGQLVEGTAAAASDVSVARGAAVFLETPSGNATFYVAGTPGSGTTTTVSPGANLIGAPTAAAFDLNSNTATWSAIAASTFTTSGNKIKSKGDMIQVPTSDSGFSTVYYYKQGTGWVKAVVDGETTTYSASGCEIPAGQGFWYIRKAGTDPMTITW